jgi:hypothetical protein
VTPLCFVLIPFGVRRGPGGRPIDFEAVYANLVVPAITDAGLEPLRADGQQASGAVGTRMFEHFMMSDYAVAELTAADPVVFYKVGERQAMKPRTTVPIHAVGREATMGDLGLLSSLAYTLAADGRPDRPVADREALADRLLAARRGAAGRSALQLLDVFPDIQRLKTDVFRDWVEYSPRLKGRLAEAGPSSETYSLLGRVYKDRWERAVKEGREVEAGTALAEAIDAYLKGFESDWRDAYPGVNAVTLMELADPPDPRRTAIVPVVAYAVARRIAAGHPDYWDHATRLELAVLARDEAAAAAALADALAAVRERWEPATTVRNLRLIREVRAGRGDVVPWAEAIEKRLAG